jgi:hypothetical protein
MPQTPRVFLSSHNVNIDSRLVLRGAPSSFLKVAVGRKTDR